MKKLLFLLLLSQSIIFCYSQATIEDLESEIKSYQSVIDGYQKQIDSVRFLIEVIKADQYRELTSYGIPFQARVKIAIYDDPKPWLSEKLEDIPKGDTVTLMRQVEDKYEVIHKGRMGYIHKFSISDAVDDEILQSLQVQWEEQVQKEKDKETVQQAQVRAEAEARAKQDKM